jgi:hypothetical protein
MSEQTEVSGAPMWTTQEMLAEFEVVGFAYAIAVVRRKSDGVLGTLEFTHAPRLYFGFVPDEVQQ